MKEEALRKSELMLEEVGVPSLPYARTLAHPAGTHVRQDAMRFDTFLKENDAKALEAIKHAEAQAKIKQDKAQEVKRLNQQIQAIQGQMSKLKEQLEACERYKQVRRPPGGARPRARLRAHRVRAVLGRADAAGAY